MADADTDKADTDKAHTDKPGKRRAERSGPAFSVGGSVDRVRSLVATTIWVVAVVCALALAIGALLVALQMNRDNSIVRFVLDVANSIDLGVFKDFQPDPPPKATNAEVADARQSAQTKSVMVNWGLAAVIYLVAGKVLDRVVRPGS